MLKYYHEGKIKILFTTKAAGMVSSKLHIGNVQMGTDLTGKGCDMPHIELVVQFKVPKSLSIWMQQAGRAGQSQIMQARAVLLIQPMVF